MIVELILVFDTEDEESGEVVSLEEINEYAQQINLDTARAMIGYQGWRVVTTLEEEKRI